MQGSKHAKKEKGKEKSRKTKEITIPSHEEGVEYILDSQTLSSSMSRIRLNKGKGIKKEPKERPSKGKNFAKRDCPFGCRRNARRISKKIWEEYF